jgi:hypothetical protein
MARLALAIGLGLAAAADAQAKPEKVYTTVSADELFGVLEELGFRPTRAEGSTGRPILKFRIEGFLNEVFFFDPKEGRYQSYQFSVAFSLKQKPSQATMNEWNQKRRFGRCYLDADQDPNMEMDVDLDGGVTQEYLRRSVLTWSTLLRDFVKHLGK